MRTLKNLVMLGAMMWASASAWAFSSVTTLPKGQETKTSYMLVTPRGTLFADNALNATSIVTTLKYQNRTASTTDKSFQFLLFQSKNEASGYYLYNVAVGKFVGQQNGTTVSLSDRPELWYIFKHNQSFTNKSTDIAGQPNFNSADYPYCVSSEDGEINNSAIAVSVWQSETGTRTSGSSWDGGNHYQIVEAESVENIIWQEAYDKVANYEASLGQEIIGNNFSGELDPANVLSEAEQTKQRAAALDIINRFTNNSMEVEVVLDLCRTTKDCDRYTYSATSSVLTVHASSAVAACRGFYDYVKSKGAGFCSWSGRRFERPADMACEEVSLITQFRDHQYFNVVTYGYTAPYWGKERWREELDWMAFHGVDMPLMLVGSEAIYRKVFIEDFGLTKEDVDKWEVGPAHLPWFRMGNLSGNSFDGPLGDEWNENQRQLAHYLLEEMDKLGMKPVCPAFGGFVPQAFSKTGSNPSVVGWGWCKPNDRNVPNYRLSPDDARFVEVGKKFMQRWEEEYGTCKYYLSDSFNEMDVPDNLNTLTAYGEKVFDIIKSSGNPDAVWVTQGWTFCYDIRKWSKAKFDAFTARVPDNRFIVLYMSPEYAEHYGHPRDYDNTYQGFSGKGWNCTMLPNMGGKNFWTGNLNKYAKGYLNDLYKANYPGNLVGYGMTPEGVENNELLYELICDAGWTNPGKTIDLDAWLAQYEESRYGSHSDAMQNFHSVLRTTLYNTYKDHPRFAWQAANLGITGTAIGASVNATYFNAVEALFAQAEALKNSNTTLLESELIEAVSMYVGAKIENLCQTIKAKKTDKAECTRLIAALEDLMLDFDAALELHPIWNLKRWEDMAQACGNHDAVRNAKNARRIVTVWFGNHTTDEAVQDYASRIWGGLMRDYYCPRLINQLKSECGLLSGWNRYNFENQFVESAPYLTKPRQVEGNHIDFLVRLLDKAKNFGEVAPQAVDNFIASTDTESYWYIVRNVANDKVLTTTGDAQTLSVADDSKESEQMWRIVATGTDTYRLESRFGQNVAVVNGEARTYLPSIYCDVKIEKVNATPGSTTFAIKPVAGTNEFFDAEWSFEELTPSLVLEAASLDYTHYIRRLAGYTQTELFGQTGQPLSATALREGIISLQNEANNIDHKTFATFLSQWNTVLNNTVKLSENNDAMRLINLIMSAHQIIVAADAESNAVAAALLDAIKVAERAAASGNDMISAHTTLSEAILAYYEAGGVVTTTDVESLVTENTGWKMKITAVFPNGSEHAVFSNGTRLTAATEAPADAIVEFDVVKMDGETYVLKAGDQYIHWTSGDDSNKSADLDGLNEDYSPSLNTLTIKVADETGLQPTSYDKSPIATLYEVIGNGSNGQAYNFTLREKDDAWIAGNSGQKFFDDNYDNIKCRTSFFQIELIEPDGPVFPLNFDWQADVNNPHGRQINFIALTPEGDSEQQFEVAAGKVYNDMTETAVFEVTEGTNVSGRIGYNGSWMNGYFYIDLDNDRQLSFDVNQLSQTGTEVFSYSFWSGSLDEENSGQNSAGQIITGSARNSVSAGSIALPAFKAPAAGEYKVRFKVDWNSVEPGGSTKQDIIANGGFVVDAVLKVNAGIVDGIATIGTLTELIEKARRGEATLEEINSLAERILVYDLSGRRTRRLQPGSVYIVEGKRVIF